MVGDHMGILGAVVFVLLRFCIELTYSFRTVLTDCLAVLSTSFLTLTYCDLPRSNVTYLAFQLRSSTYLLLLTSFNYYLPVFASPFKLLLTVTDFLQLRLTAAYLVCPFTYLCSNASHCLLK